MTLFAISCLLTAILALIIALFSYFKNPLSSLNRFWAYTNFALFLWSFSFFKVITNTNENSAFFWQCILDISAIFIPVLFLHFTLLFVNVPQRMKNKILFPIYFFAITLAIISPFPPFKLGLRPIFEFNFWIVAGPYYFIFPLFFIFNVLCSFYFLFKKLKISDGIERVQTRLIFLAAGIGFGGGITNFFPQLIRIYPIGNFFIFFNSILVFYAILKHHFLDLRIIATEIFVQILIIILTLYAFSAHLWQEMIFRFFILVLVSIFGVLLIIATIKEIENLERIAENEKQLREKAERFRFFSEKLKENLSQTLQLESILSAIRNIFFQAFSIEKLSFAFKQPTSDFYEIRKFWGFKREEGISLMLETNLIKIIEREKRTLTREDIRKIAEKENVVDEKIRLFDLEKKIDQFEIGVVFPLFQQDILVGIFFLSRKKDGSEYTSTDLELLETLSYPIAISIQNSLLYEQIMKDKEILEKFYRLTVGRELKMAELKNKIKELESRLIHKNDHSEDKRGNKDYEGRGQNPQ